MTSRKAEQSLKMQSLSTLVSPIICQAQMRVHGPHSNKVPPLPRLPSPLQERAHNLEEQDSRPPLRSASRCTPASSHTALPPPHPTGACAQP